MTELRFERRCSGEDMVVCCFYARLHIDLVGGGVGVVLFVAGESQGHGHGHGFTKTRVDERASSCSHFERFEPTSQRESQASKSTAGYKKQ